MGQRLRQINIHGNGRPVLEEDTLTPYCLYGKRFPLLGEGNVAISVWVLGVTTVPIVLQQLVNNERKAHRLAVVCFLTAQVRAIPSHTNPVLYFIIIHVVEWPVMSRLPILPHNSLCPHLYLPFPPQTSRWSGFIIAFCAKYFCYQSPLLKLMIPKPLTSSRYYDQRC